MKNIIIEVPRNGASIQLALRAGAARGQAVIVASDDVEIRLQQPVPAEAALGKPLPATDDGKSHSTKAKPHDLDLILKRLLKLKPTKHATAANSIKAMFQFDAPITDEAANKILEDLSRRGHLSFDTNDKLQFRNA
jgi:hypothetical protein